MSNAMLSITEIQNHYAHLSSDLLAVILEIHDIVATVNPIATEEFRRQGIVYYDPRRGGPVKAGICQSLIFRDKIHLAFIHGAFLPDPGHLLKGTTMPKRYLSIKDYETAPWEAVRELIHAHNQFDVFTLTTKP